VSASVLWVTQDFPPDKGGIQTYSAELVRALVELGHEVDVVAPERPQARAYDRAFPARVHRLPGPRDAMPAIAIPFVLAMTGRKRFDVVVHAQWPTATGSVLARRRERIGALVLAAHGRELLWRPRVLAGAYDRWRRTVLHAADRVVAVSRYTGGLVRDLGVDASRTCVVSNGTDVARLHRSAVIERAATLRATAAIGPGPLVVTVARLVPHKGIDTVIRALPEVARAVPGVQYVVVGGGHDRARLVQLAHAAGIAHRVHFVGCVDDDEVSAWLHACDVLALPSRERRPDVEGFGIVLLDAAACGRPVVAGRSGGIADAVIDGETGLLCDPDRTDEVARALIDVLRDRELARRLGAAGRERVERDFTWAHAGRRLHAIVENAHGVDELSGASHVVDDHSARCFSR
jgi:phosphatidylinositol alpha-1,6-mannosyltransferase